MSASKVLKVKHSAICKESCLDYKIKHIAKNAVFAFSKEAKRIPFIVCLLEPCCWNLKVYHLKRKNKRRQGNC